METILMTLQQLRCLTDRVDSLSVEQPGEYPTTMRRWFRLGSRPAMNRRFTQTGGTMLLVLLLDFLSLGALPAASGAEPSFSADRLLGHVRILASDEFEGRAPGSPGEEKTVNYLIEQFKSIGLEPGNPDGTFVQRVPLVGIVGNPAGSYRVAGKQTSFQLPRDCVLWSRRFVPEVAVTDSEMVFVGYGVVAPEYGWDDFKDVDVRGKTLVMLVGDPPVPDPSDPAKLDDTMFEGRAMTYYGRWTYKYESAARQGAAATLIVHETGPAGYPFQVVINSHTGERFQLKADGNLDLPAAEGWITVDQARKMFGAAGQNYDALKQAAMRRDFRPVSLACRASFTVKNTVREVVSRNVVARLPGTDPELKEDLVIYSAHWDHLGRNPKLDGDTIYHGAYDNATGVAGMLEIARRFVDAKRPLRRSLLFLMTTAEEKGLLGARYYVENPLYPLARTLANINLDGLNSWGCTRDVSVVGLGSTTLEDLLETAAEAQGRILVPELQPEKGYFFRADNFEFVKAGVPALKCGGGLDYIGKPAGFGKKKRDEFTQNDYHKVTDVIKPDWDLSGGLEDLQLLYAVGRAVANADRWPEWKNGSEFRARRESMLKSHAPREANSNP